MDALPAPRILAPKCSCPVPIRDEETCARCGRTVELDGLTEQQRRDLDRQIRRTRRHRRAGWKAAA
jgi:hypothetical protein